VGVEVRLRPRVTGRGIVAAVLAIAVAAVCVRLGFWQLDRLEQRRILNAAHAEALALDPVDLNAAGLSILARDGDDLLYRRGFARGRFDHAGEFLLRGRSHDGRPGVHLVTPLQLLDESGVVLVNRGWIPSPDGATADPRPFRVVEDVAVAGTFQRMPDAGDQASPVTVDLGDLAVATYRRLDRGLLGETMSLPLPLYYLQAASPPDGPAGPPIPVPDPTLDEGAHLGYAVQWFSFAAIALFGFLFTAVLRSRAADESRPPPPSFVPPLHPRVPHP